ncbi:MAG TPA: antitoxin MazE5 [Acidimicrobiales bacterium]|jgi:hypothetical protein|nr:antitoxin MazE5 [Acidimicrobiales bacterium]
MTRTRISTTVDERLLAEARRLRPVKDAELLDEALRGLVRLHREAEIDADYTRAYGEHPIDEPDEWGDLASFRRAVAASRGRGQ